MLAQNNRIKKHFLVNGFSLIELIFSMFVFGILVKITSPYAINWLRSQQLISYSGEIKEFIRLVRSEARRWGTSCEVMLSNDIKSYKTSPLQINCIGHGGPVSNIRLIQPTPPNNQFQLLNRRFVVNPRGKIVGNSPVVFIFGHQLNEQTSPNLIRCLTIDPFNNYIREGRYAFQFPVDFDIGTNYIETLDSRLCN